MRIFYVTNARLPTEKAHGLATVKLCEAFAKLGHEVTVFHPWRSNPLPQDAYEYYGVKRDFKIVTLPSIDLLWLGFGERFFFLVQLMSFSLVAAFWLWIRYYLLGGPRPVVSAGRSTTGLRDTVMLSHDHVPLFLATFFAPKIFYDIHHYPERTWLYTRVLKRAIGVGVQTKWKVGALGKDFGIPASEIVYWPNGTDIERFDIPLDQREARQRLGLPPDGRMVLYAGSLQRWKGVEALVEAGKIMPEGVATYVVGGSQKEVGEFRIQNLESRIHFVGQRPWAEIPIWLKAADVFVLPNTGRMEVSRHYTSPMKLFEYMAAGRPIVASDIPSIREIVDETMVFFARADDPRSFADAIQAALANPAEAQRRAERARQEVGQYTWEARADKILAQVRAALG